MPKLSARLARRALFALATVFFALTLGSGTSWAADSLFTDVGPVAVSEYSQPEQVKRFRYVGIERGVLPRRLRSGVAKPELDLPLFGDARFTGVVEKVETVGGARTWTGRLKGQRASSFTIVRVGNVFMAKIASTGEVYEVTWVRNGVYRIEELDHSKYQDHGSNWPVRFGPLPTPDEIAEAAAEDGRSPIDILIGYSDDARRAAGGNKQIKALIALAVSETNQSYKKSGVKTKLRLLHVEEYNYSEAGALATDVGRLVNGGDGQLDDIQTIRNTYGADMVGFIVNDGGGKCGRAAGIYPGATKAYMVTARNCATGYYSFGHEFGHIQGARHDTYVDNTNTPYAFGHGYTDWRAPSPWRTVMAYNNKCRDKGKSCVRKDHWSNPKKRYKRRRTGTGSTKNYKVLNKTASPVANYRKRIISGDVKSTFNRKRGRKGWRAKSGSWGSCGSRYYCSNGLSGTGAWAGYKGDFGDVTYEVRMKRSGDCETCANRFYIRGESAAIAHTNWPRPAYAFQYTNTGSCSVWKVSDAGDFTPLLSWTSCSALKQNWNRLKVIAVGKKIKFIINGTLVWVGSDTDLRVGEVGIGFYRDGDDPGRLSADWAKIKTTPTSSAESAPAAAVALGDAVDALPSAGGDFDQSPN